MALDRKTYTQYVEDKSPKSPIVKNTVKAFLIGGAICTVGEVFSQIYKYFGLTKEDAPIAVSATMIFLGALLTGLKIYDKIAKHAGAGTLVPITGFSNAIVSAALEYKSEGFVMGMSAMMFKIAGPVLVFGISGSIIYGLILCLIG